MRGQKMGTFEQIAVVEPMPIDDIFVTGLARVEFLPGGMIRFWFYADESLMHRTRVIKARLVVPLVCALAMNLEARELLTPLRERMLAAFNPLQIH
jgi:hypothetical protein